MSKNKFTNAFANALGKPTQPDLNLKKVLEPKRPNVQTSKMVEIQTFKRPEDQAITTEQSGVNDKVKISTNISLQAISVDSTIIKATKKLSLKDRGWLPITMYLPSEIKQKLQIQSVNEGRDMSEIVAESLAK